MSKYQPLSDRLRGHPADEWRASFSELEDVLGFPLPKGARTRAWWDADGAKPHSRSWSAQGWQAHEVDPALGLVTFRRGGISPAVVEAVAGLQPVGDLSGIEPPESSLPGPPSAALSGAPSLKSLTQDPAEDEPAASERWTARTTRIVGATALAAGAALVAGIGALAVRAVGRRL
jgi:hypothetical protein